MEDAAAVRQPAFPRLPIEGGLRRHLQGGIVGMENQVSFRRERCADAVCLSRLRQRIESTCGAPPVGCDGTEVTSLSHSAGEPNRGTQAAASGSFFHISGHVACGTHI